VSAWSTYTSDLQRHLALLAKTGCDCPFFRGHTDSRWNLLCSLGRRSAEEFKKNRLETILYYDFMSQGGPLLDRPSSSWDVLFLMQHHGLPTRLLDWSSTFGVALYFAIKPLIGLLSSAPESLEQITVEPCVWVLDPFELNRHMHGEPVVLNPELDLEGTYQEIFIEEQKTLGAKVMAVNPTQIAKRLAAQRGCFTLHAEMAIPLEAGSPAFLRKFDIPFEAIPEAVQFLQLFGMNEYTLFPDLDGLARHLRGQHVDWM
jgi:FRG domain